MLSKIVSKVLVDKGVLSGQGEFTVLFKETEVFFLVDDVSKDVKAVVEDRGRGCTGDNVLGAVWNVEEGVILLIFKSGPDEFGG